MQIQELFIRSNEELRRGIDKIQDDQWGLDMPPNSSSQPTKLLKAVNYHAYDDAWVADVLAGKTKEEVGDKYDSLRGTDQSRAITTYDDHNARAIAAVRDFRDLDKPVHLSYGDFPAREYLQHIISFRGVRVYDIAKLIGTDTTMAEDLVKGLWDEFTPVIESYRQMGVFPPAVEAPEGANTQTKLLALFGRS
jgi:hypothetical protein